MKRIHRKRLSEGEKIRLGSREIYLSLQIKVQEKSEN